MNIEEHEDQRTAAAEDTETESKQTPEGEGADAQNEEKEDSLEALLREYDETRSAQSAPQQPSSEPKEQKQSETDVNALAALEARIQEQEAREQSRDMEALLGRMTEGVEADDVDAEGFLIAAAKRNPQLEKFYVERKANPKRWKDTEKALKADFEKRFGKKVDKGVTESRSSLASAVRSASTAAPDQDSYNPDEVAKMSKDEFDNLQRKMGISPI